MPRRVTMHLRSSRRSLAFLLLILVGTASAGQNSQAPGETFPPQVAPQNPTPPKQDAPKPESPKPEASSPQEQPPSGQEDNSGFVFHTRVYEVLLHATVV